MDRFSKKVLEEIGSYVYALVDPVKQEVFYIGKGNGNRVFNHAKESIASGDAESKESLKIDRIRKIIDSGHQVGHFILRHGLSDEAALAIEATLIDFLNFKQFKNFNLSNLVAGHYSEEKGIATVREIEDIYHAEPISKQDFKHNVLLININKSYVSGGSIYDAVRKDWKLDIDRAKKMDFVIAEYQGILKGIYQADNWFYDESKKRYYFEGQEVVDKKICKIYLGKFFMDKKLGQANPIMYVEPIKKPEPISKQDFKHNVLLINLNKSYVSGKNIYDAVRKYWKLDIDRAKKMDFVIAEYKGILKGIYQADNWFYDESRGRYYFEGQEVVDKKICKIYLGKSFVGKKLGQANPIMYIEI